MMRGRLRALSHEGDEEDEKQAKWTGSSGRTVINGHGIHFLKHTTSMNLKSTL